MREPRSVELHVSKPAGGHSGHVPWSFQQATVTPLMMEEFTNDDTEMAGIVPSHTPRMHRLWSRPLSRDRNEEFSVSVSASANEARKHVHRSVLRRLIRRPPLDKTRSLLLMPTTMNTAENVMISGWMPPRRSARPIMTTDRAQTALSPREEAQFITERRHRRCHSEQPRAWRRPSATLWTLKEEGGNEEAGPWNHRSGV